MTREAIAGGSPRWPRPARTAAGAGPSFDSVVKPTMPSLDFPTSAEGLVLERGR